MFVVGVVVRNDDVKVGVDGDGEDNDVARCWRLR